jgi:hypothetical protein
MLLYHGTTEGVARKSLTQGLTPRGSRKSNWEHSCPSRDDLVYLTRSYAPYFAFTASPVSDIYADIAASAQGEQVRHAKWGIIEVDTNRLDMEELVPDEDFLEQASRSMALPPEDEIEHSDFAGLQLCETMEERTAWWRGNVEIFSHLWDKSIEGLGNCAHMGPIPSSAITRIAIYDPKSNPNITMLCLDPSITLMNYKMCGSKHRGVTDWIFGAEVDPMDLFGGFGSNYTTQENTGNKELDAFLQHERERLAGIEKVLVNRTGLEIIDNS